MGVTAAQHAASVAVTGTTVSVSFTNPPAVGSVVCVSMTWFDGVNANAGTVTIADGNSNSYTVTPNSPSNTHPTDAGIVYHAYWLAVGTPHKTITATFTRTTGAGGSVAISIDEFAVSGGTAAFDTDVAGNGASGTAVNTPTVTVTGSNELTYSTAIGGAAAITAVNSPWTPVYANGAMGEAVGYILSRTGNVAVAMTAGASSDWDAMGMSFAFTPSGGGSPTYPQLERRIRGYLRGVAEAA